MTINSTTPTTPPWIRRIDSLSAMEAAQLADGYPFLPIDEDLAFDLLAWADAEPWKGNALQPLEGANRRVLREEIMSRGMDRKPVIELPRGWIADGNTRLLVYDECYRDGHPVHFPGFEVREFRDDEERADFQMACAIVHRHLSTKQRKCLVRAGIQRHPEWTDNRLGALHGLTQDTVTRISDEMIAAAEIPSRPERRVGADGREYDAPKLRSKKPKPTPALHPAAALIAAWHCERGGHGTTADDLLLLSADAGIDLLGLVKIADGPNDRATRLALTAWLWTLCGERFGDHTVVGARAKNSWSTFNLIRTADLRRALLRPAGGGPTSENRSTEED